MWGQKNVWFACISPVMDCSNHLGLPCVPSSGEVFPEVWLWWKSWITSAEQEPLWLDMCFKKALGMINCTVAVLLSYYVFKKDQWDLSSSKRTKRIIRSMFSWSFPEGTLSTSVMLKKV